MTLADTGLPLRQPCLMKLPPCHLAKHSMMSALDNVDQRMTPSLSGILDTGASVNVVAEGVASRLQREDMGIMSAWQMQGQLLGLVSALYAITITMKATMT